MKYREFGYFLSLIPIFLVIYGNLTGGIFTALNILFSMVFLVIADWLFTENSKNLETTSPVIIPNSVLVFHVIFHSLAIFSLLFGIYSGIIKDSFIFLAILSTGISSGMSGIIVGHELIHRPKKFWNYLGLLNLWTVSYLHWYVEHIRVHHKYVGISNHDSATAKYGENIYKFVARTIPQQYVSAYKEEVRFLTKKGKNPILSNFVLKGTLITLLTYLILSITLGLTIFLAFLFQSMIAIILLEMVNYAEHYGLSRDENEKVNFSHSWQTDNKLSRFMLIELVRHPDHHLVASKEYQDLQSHKEAPKFPTGYWGMFPIALIPPLWYKVIHPRIAKLHLNS